MRFRFPRIRAVRPLIPRFSYSPKANGKPDPGEVVWAWVPYEEDSSQGKDRPVLVIGKEGRKLLALSLTSRDHDLDVGPGVTCRAGVDGHRSRVRGTRGDVRARSGSTGCCAWIPSGVRREGAALPKDVFDAVLEAARPYF